MLQFVHDGDHPGKSSVMFLPMIDMNPTDVHDGDHPGKSSVMFLPMIDMNPTDVHDGDHPGKLSVMFLPMIDMNPTAVPCVYSTLMFISEHAHRHNGQPIITFDQPLRWKAFLITATEQPNSDLRNIVLCLGGFHTEMSLLGSI